VARAAPWLALLAAYVAALLLLDPGDASVQAPRLLDAIEDGAGRDATRVALAATTVVAFALAATLGRTWVPDPWAGRAVLLGALSPAGFALSVSTAAPPAALLAAGLLLAIRTREHPTRGRALGGAACLALAPWFGPAFAVPAVPALAALVYWTYRRGRRLYAFLALEFAGASVVTLVGVAVSEDAGPSPGVDGVLEILLYAPVLALTIPTAVLLVRSRRERVSRAIPARRDAEVAAGLTGVVLIALAVAAALASIGPEAGVPIAAALAAWALRAFPRTGALLGAATLALTVWVGVALATGDAGRWLAPGIH
jgi:hypothetical protein